MVLTENKLALADEKANSQELSSPGGKPCPGGNEEEGNIGNGSDCDSGKFTFY